MFLRLSESDPGFRNLASLNLGSQSPYNATGGDARVSRNGTLLSSGLKIDPKPDLNPHIPQEKTGENAPGMLSLGRVRAPRCPPGMEQEPVRDVDAQGWWLWPWVVPVGTGRAQPPQQGATAGCVGAKPALAGGHGRVGADEALFCWKMLTWQNCCFWQSKFCLQKSSHFQNTCGESVLK